MKVTTRGPPLTQQIIAMRSNSFVTILWSLGKAEHLVKCVLCVATKTDELVCFFILSLQIFHRRINCVKKRISLVPVPSWATDVGWLTYILLVAWRSRTLDIWFRPAPPLYANRLAANEFRKRSRLGRTFLRLIVLPFWEAPETFHVNKWGLLFPNL